MSIELLNEVQELFNDIKVCGDFEEFMNLRLHLLLSPSDVKVMRECLARARKRAVKLAEQKNTQNYIDLMRNSLGDNFTL